MSRVGVDIILVSIIMCFYGWHSSGPLIPWETCTQESSLSEWSPYLSSILMILRHINTDLACIQSADCEVYAQHIEQVTDIIITDYILTPSKWKIGHYYKIKYMQRISFNYELSCTWIFKQARDFINSLRSSDAIYHR